MKLEVHTYEQLEGCVKAFKKGTFNVLFVIGNPGQSKTTTVQKILGTHPDRGPRYLKGGAISAYQLYLFLYNAPTRDFVLDDCDSLYSDPSCVRLLKALCETEEVKSIQWNTANARMEADGVKQEFKSKSRVVIILNHWDKLHKSVLELEDRGLMVFFKPTVEEVLANGRAWFKDKEVLKFVENHRMYIQALSLRAMVIASEMRQAGLPSWREALVESLGIGPLVLVDRLLGDPRYLDDNERYKAFHEATAKDGKNGLSRSTWYGLKNKLAQLRTEYAAFQVLHGGKAEKTASRGLKKGG